MDVVAAMPKYDEYKDSGVDWLGNIPHGWGIKKIYHLFRIGRGRVISQQELVDDGAYPVYSSQTKNNGVLGYIETYDLVDYGLHTKIVECITKEFIIFKYSSSEYIWVMYKSGFVDYM